MVIPPTRVTPKTLASLVDLLLVRRALIARRAEIWRSDAVDAFADQDRSDLFDHDEPSVDFDAAAALMLVQRAEQRLWAADQALARVANGTFGHCTACGTRIPVERLRVLPATATCVACSGRSSDRAWRVGRDRMPANGEQSRSTAVPGMLAAGARR